VVGVAKVETTGAPARLGLTADRPSIRADGADVVVFTVSAHDAADRLVPTAGNLAEFSVTGGRIIGVGNGDPGCHEADRFVETRVLVLVEDWRGRIAPAGTAMPSTHASLAPMRLLGNWLATRPKSGELYDLSATFTLAAAPTGRVELFLPALGSRTTLWLNGRELGHALDTTQNGPALVLEASQLVVGENRVQLIVTPFADNRNHIPELSRLGTVALTDPAPPARRSLFNGLAQVIVQADAGAGAIRLTAKSAGLEPATGVVTLQATRQPPSLP
jgi:beta-galactosidase